MPKALTKTMAARVTAASLALILAASAMPQASHADVIDGEIPVKAVITLGEAFHDISSGDDMTDDEYRSFFDDMVDTSEVLKAEFEQSKSQLKMVSSKLVEFEVSTKETLITYDEALEHYNARVKYYQMVRDALLQSATPITEENGSMTYSTRKNESPNYTLLNIDRDDSWTIVEFKDDQKFNLAYVSPQDFAAFKLTSDYSDVTMVASTEDEVYIGTVTDLFKYDGTGTEYKDDGSIRSGKWSDGNKTGLHYIYDVENEYKSVTQYKDGYRHGMSTYQSFDSENITTRVFIDNKISGCTYSEFYYDNFNAELMYYYLDEERLPITYITYPGNGLTRLIIGEDDDAVEIYDSETYQRLFIADFEESKPSGFGYSQYGEIEYIGNFKGFDFTGEGYFYHIDDEENVLSQKVDEIIDEIIEKKMTDRQKLLAVHDYVVENVKYHRPTANAEDHPGYTHTAYGALMKGSAVCDGYAQAFKLLVDELGFENHLIFGITIDETGEFQESNRHAWNIVEYNGEFTHFDTTWDDPSFSEKIRYKYYFIDSKEISEDHRWSEDDYEIYLAPTQPN